MRLKVFLGVAAGFLVLAVVLLLLSSRAGNKSQDSVGGDAVASRKTVSGANAGPALKGKDRNTKKTQADLVGEKDTSASKATKKRAMRLGEVKPSDVDASDSSVVTAKLDELLDNDDYDAVLREAVRLKTHPDAEVRSRVLLALHWTGLNGLGDLTGMLGDPDPDVAREAMDYWKMALSEVENSADKAELLTKAGEVLGSDMPLDTFSDLLSEINTLEEADAVPALVSLLKQTEDPDRVSETIGTLDTIINSDKSIETKEEAEQAAKMWAQNQLSEEVSETGNGILRRNVRKSSVQKK